MMYTAVVKARARDLQLEALAVLYVLSGLGTEAVDCCNCRA